MNIYRGIAQILLCFFILSCTGRHLYATEYRLEQKIPLPVEKGNGTAGAFIGIVGKTMIIAGGSDFPNGGPWENGKKVWSDAIYLLRQNGKKYECILCQDSKLPRPLGGGCSVSTSEGMLCFGGTDGKEYSESVYRILPDGNNAKIDKVSSLPEGFIPAAAAFHKDRVYIHGTKYGKNAFYIFYPARGIWSPLSSCPSRVIYEGASLISKHNGREDALYLIGGRGIDEEGLHIASNVWEYIPAKDVWNKKVGFTSEGSPTNNMYSSAVSYGAEHIIIFGGDGGKEFIRRSELENKIASAKDEAIADSLRAELRQAFIKHPGFSNNIYAYHPITNTWITSAKTEESLPAVTTAAVLDGKIIIPSGEKHPGVRSNDILIFSVHENKAFGWLNYTVLCIYLIGMLGVGFFFSKKEKNTEQFFKGGSRIPWWAAGISIFATALSAITFLSIPAKAYSTDWNMFMFNMSILLIVPIIIHFYLPFFRKLNVASAYQYLEERFSLAVRMLASSFFCIFMFARVAIVLFLPSLALNAVTGIDIYLCILMMGIVTIIYCTMGGIEAVIWGDVVQGTLLVAGAILCLVWLISSVDGGLTEVVEIAVRDNKFNILDFSFDWTRPVFWVTIFGGLANQFLTYSSDQSVIQRYITVKNQSDSAKGLWLNGLLSIPIALLFFGIGTGLYVFFKTHPDILAVSMTNSDSIFPHYIMCELPAGIAGLLIAAIFAAAMSTLSSNINSASTVLTEDFYAKYAKNPDEKKKLSFARLSGILIGGLGITMALALATFDIVSLWDQFNFFLGLLTSGLGGLFMMGIFTRRIGTKAAFTGFAGSIAVLIICQSYTHISVVLYGFIGLISCFIIGWLSSFIYGYNK